MRLRDQHQQQSCVVYLPIHSHKFPIIDFSAEINTLNKV